ncbi:MAG: hypothetical protein IJ324_05445 [Lachnospiraceae bacterium]|nr:hypothetical protein [Lachnospiraceae bacterium]
MMNKGRAIKYLILEALLAVCLFAAAIGIRVYNMPVESFGLGSFYAAAAVESQKAVPHIPGSGITQIYLYMLRGLFLIFGNIWQVGTIAQIVLFILGGAVFYLAVRKVSGSIGSLVIVGAMLCLPCFLPITYSYGPQMLYFLLFGIGLYYTHSFVVGGSEREEFGVLFYVQTILTGLYAGLLIYLDIFSVILVLPVILLPYLFRNNMGVGKGIGIALLWILSAVVGILGCGIAESMNFGVSMDDLLLQWLLYGVKMRQDMHIWLGIFMAATYIVTLIYFVTYLIFQRSSRSIRELDVEGLLKNQLEDEVQTTGETEAEKEIQVETQPATTFIENPLPLPKKHVKKTLDYAFEPDFEDMDYDIHTFEKDDYDL